ncbi:Acyl-CoA dehydrogenase member 10 [Perkinsus olseni]|uniref:Acyl-CoA dehydrogenase member 10 n=1 Tax=Perkinsus olseni TaxID=32597 RepID=A0A7J6PI30_PEROL|nr:Acyl-CoA dehydrogenase member 10 [Perkinsus olseni]
MSGVPSPPAVMSEHAQEMLKKLNRFVEEVVKPGEVLYREQHSKSENRWACPPVMEEMKAEAKKRGCPGLTTFEYAHLCEVMGKHLLAAEATNCSAPDTGNMEVLLLAGNAEQKERWLKPLLEGRIRSTFLMTEPNVASSDASNISIDITRDGDDYVINGTKWWSSGAVDERCKVGILLGKVNSGEGKPLHQQQSMLVPMDTPGIRVVRALTVFGYDDAPHGHALARLGPGRIHHCMRAIGMAERALEIAVDRAHRRKAFGKLIAHHGGVMTEVAECRVEIEAARALVLRAAAEIDAIGVRGAHSKIAAIKVVAPRMACEVIDRCIQICGGAGVSGDLDLAYLYALARPLRIADGPDAELRAGAVTNGPHGRPKLQEANSMVNRSWRSWQDPNEVARVLRALVGSYRDEGSTPDASVCLDMLAYLEERISEMADLPGLVHSVGFISTPVGVLQDAKLCAARDKFLEKAFDRLKRRHGNQWKRMDLPLVAAVKNYRPQYRDFIIAVLDTAARELAVELPVFLHAYAFTEETGHAIVDTSISILSSHVDKVPFWVLSRSTAHLATIAAREHSGDALIAFFRQLSRLECTEIAEFAREIFAFYTALWRLNEALHEKETESMRRWLGSKLEHLAATKEDIFFDGFALENLCVLLSKTKLEASGLLQEIAKRVLDEDLAALSPPALIQCSRLLSEIPSSPSATLQRRLADHICRVQWLSPGGSFGISNLH